MFVIMVLYVVIPTIRSFKAAYDQLLQTLLETAKVPVERIVTVFANEKENCMSSDNTVCLRNNIFEYSAPVGFHVFLMRKGNDESNDAMVWLQDTCHVGPDFWKLANDMYVEHVEYERSVTWACENGQCNIGILSSQFCKRMYDDLVSVPSISKDLAIAMEHNATNQSPKRYYSQDDPKQFYVPIANVPMGTSRVYSDTMIRFTLYYPSLDVKKHFGHYPSNDGQHFQVP